MSAETKKQLSRIEGLLVLLLQKLGATSAEIGEVMDVDSSTVRHHYPPSGVSMAKLKIDNRDD